MGIPKLKWDDIVRYHLIQISRNSSSVSPMIFYRMVEILESLLHKDILTYKPSGDNLYFDLIEMEKKRIDEELKPLKLRNYELYLDSYMERIAHYKLRLLCHFIRMKAPIETIIKEK